MTFEEFQSEIERMLAVQRSLQESQLRLQSNLEQMQANLALIDNKIERVADNHLQAEVRMNRLEASIERHERLIDRLIGYSLTNETDHLNLEERMMQLEQRMREIRGNRQ